MADALPLEGLMNRIYQHCGVGLIVGNACRVTTEEEDITLLDMIVCSLVLWKKTSALYRIRSEQISTRSYGSQCSRLGI